MVAHRVGAVSLFRDRTGSPEGPALVGVLEEGIYTRTTGIGFDPYTSLAYLTNNDPASTVQLKGLDRIGVALAGGVPYLYSAGAIGLAGVSRDRDTRDVGFDPDSMPGKALVVARTPASLIVADTAQAVGAAPAMSLAVSAVGAGASRLTLGRIGADTRLFAFVSCFDARELYIVDIARGEPLAVVRGLSGPFDLVLDRWRERVYLADFRSSSIRIVDLAPLACRTQGQEADCGEVRITATLGKPSLPSELI
jgi:hypothetical protein